MDSSAACRVGKLDPDYRGCGNLARGPSANLHGAEGALHAGYFVVCGGIKGKDETSPQTVGAAAHTGAST